MRLGDLARWLDERRANCLRLATTKRGMDQVGWLEDARFYAAAIAVVDRASDNGMVETDEKASARPSRCPRTR